ncbi:alpha-glucoside transport system permease protein [Actinokineospora alba]|uniref:Alpha-glucoside transport system permease protein n=1 Tax=Actinokineospora alba TaxID=504798 RepID=A0A1H0L4P9_9PSEU|nr:alpha-glucoside transport system permease protein [Actinokineospora alba]SDJ04701.1 alpha-glucoside transport system permease protein [Actinokineospora alba]SDO63032.1 alpha-glucoside transport system permease protein [Actinokineospora alba]
MTQVLRARRGAAEPGRSPGKAALFLLPAVLLLGSLVVYPLVYSLFRSFFDASGDKFVGLGNYEETFTDPRTLIAFRNNVIWVVVAPAVVTCLGLIFAVLTERIRWATAFRLILFMPMAISLLASGIIFRLVYEQDPERGVVNAAMVGVHDVFATPSSYPGARPRSGFDASERGYTSTATVSPGGVVSLPLVGYSPQQLPTSARPVSQPSAGRNEVRGAVWLDVSTGGRSGRIDPAERGLPGLTVEIVRDGAVVATTMTGDDGRFTFPNLGPGEYSVRLPSGNFALPFRGLTWLGPALVTPVIISSWIWIMTGFAITFIAAGLSAIPRDALEAARVDGATEWQVFKRVTVPLLAPVLLTVFVTLVINVLKIFELVFVIAPGSVQEEANVLALQMWQVSFGAGGDQGVGSALAIILFLLVAPAMLYNIRRFRRERS